MRFDTIYPHIEGVEKRAKPEECRCGNTEHKLTRRPLFKDSAGYDVWGLQYVCPACGVGQRMWCYINRHSEYPLLNDEQRQKLRRARQAKNWTLKDLSVYSRVSVSRLSDYERGNNGLPPENVELIEHYLEIKLC